MGAEVQGSKGNTQSLSRPGLKTCTPSHLPLSIVWTTSGGKEDLWSEDTEKSPGQREGRRVGATMQLTAGVNDKASVADTNHQTWRSIKKRKHGIWRASLIRIQGWKDQHFLNLTDSGVIQEGPVQAPWGVPFYTCCLTDSASPKLRHSMEFSEVLFQKRAVNKTPFKAHSNFFQRREFIYSKFRIEMLWWW